MTWKRFITSLAAISILLSACASQKPVTTVSAAIDKPHLTLYDACDYEPDAPFAQCEIEGFRKALEESAEQTRQLMKLKAELDAAEAHANVDSWFYEGQIAKERQLRQEAESDKWWFMLGGAGGGVIITTLLFLFATN